MLLMIVLIVMIIGVALLLALYSGFLPFMNTYGNATHYAAAYYGAVSALERGVLAVRYSGPGFESSDGWEGGSGAINGFYVYGDGDNTLKWDVVSKTTQIPRPGEGDVDPILRENDDGDYNVLKYGETLNIPLGVIETGNLYEKNSVYRGNFGNNSEDGVFVELKLNTKLMNAFGGVNGGLLCKPNGNSYCTCAPSYDTLVVADWSIRSDDATWLPNVFLTSQKTVEPSRDSMFRASYLKWSVNDINCGGIPMKFGRNNHPLYTSPGPGFRPNVTSNSNGTIPASFAGVMNGSNPYLTLSLPNYLIGLKQEIARYYPTNNIYPFLEYRITSSSPISDKNFSIAGEGKVGNYDIKIEIKKPTLEQSAIGNFTIIF